MRTLHASSIGTGMPRTKRCSSCERRKPLAAFGRKGVDSWCRPCRREYQRRWLAEHREAYNAKHRAYYQEHRTELREYNREYQRRRRALMGVGKWKGRSLLRGLRTRPRAEAAGSRRRGRSGARGS